ncbi:hypothetical protein [Streptomyces sp. NPDC127190]|uniref:hypothetical protein n=1 Tax=unclassified Streptomyces TaxID=2593676 RepID=UPI0036391DB9
MAVDQLPAEVREFVSYLDALVARLDRAAGWNAVFWQRDPEGMQACLDGREMPPWDVVEALLQDLGLRYGAAVAAAEGERARALHAAALDAYDARPGARDALADRLDVMLREQRYAAERQAVLSRRLSTANTAEEAESLRQDLAWAHDDHTRATARCAELRARIAQVDRRELAVVTADSQVLPSAASQVSRLRQPASAQPLGPDAHGFPPSASLAAPGVFAGRTAGAPAPEAAPGGKGRKRRRGSARFAGVGEGEDQPVVVPRAGGPADGGRTPRGARFAGAAEPAEPAEPVSVAPVDAGAHEAVAETVLLLARLRDEGRSGEAHVLLVEAAQWPAGRFPLLADALRHAGLGADWATLLWEAAALPAERLVAVADALAGAGWEADGERMLRQGVARPAAEIGAAVLHLEEAGRRRDVLALLDAYVRVRSPEEAARSVAADPRRLVPLLLQAARAVSEERHWDLVHALRVAGHTP